MGVGEAQDPASVEGVSRPIDEVRGEGGSLGDVGRAGGACRSRRGLRVLDTGSCRIGAKGVRRLRRHTCDICRGLVMS